jgi:hypothetical protein
MHSVTHLLSHLVFPHPMLLTLSFGDSFVELLQKLLCLGLILEHAHERLDLLALGRDANLYHLGSLDHVQGRVEQGVEVQTDFTGWIGAHEDTRLGCLL